MIEKKPDLVERLAKTKRLLPYGYMKDGFPEKPEKKDWNVLLSASAIPPLVIAAIACAAYFVRDDGAYLGLLALGVLVFLISFVPKFILYRRMSGGSSPQQ